MIAPAKQPLERVEEPQNSGGQGVGVSILADTRRTRSDLRMIGMSAKKRWPTKESHKRIIRDRLMEIVQKRTVGVMSKGGPVELEAPADANAIAAARVYGLFESQNQADDHHAEGELVTHEHIVDERRDRLAAIASRLGVGVVVEAISVRPTSELAEPDVHATHGNGSGNGHADQTHGKASGLPETDVP